MPYASSPFDGSRELEKFQEPGTPVVGPEAIQTRGVRQVLQAPQKLSLDQQVERFGDLRKIVADPCRKLLAGHERVGVPGEEQQQIQITRGLYAHDIKKLFQRLHWFHFEVRQFVKSEG
jgi:hypothetical protein